MRCRHGHSFDVARQGYVNLSTGRLTHPGDTAEMVAARAEFLSAGHYDFISAALASAAAQAAAQAAAEATADATSPVADTTSVPDASPVTDAGLVVDAGAGTGHHLAAVLDILPGMAGLALDAAKPAVRRAARAHPRAAAALCDTWRRLPLATHAASLVLNVFAPRNGAEFHRILHPGGRLLVVTPTAEHLAELVGPLGLLSVDADKRGRVAASLSAWFEPTGERHLRRSLRLTHAEVRALVAMGPSAWHTDPEELAVRIAALPAPAAVTASVALHAFRPHRAPRHTPEHDR